MVKLQEVNNQYFITIPKEYVYDKGWKKGQEIIIGFNSDGDILLRAGKPRQNSLKHENKVLEEGGTS